MGPWLLAIPKVIAAIPATVGGAKQLVMALPWLIQIAFEVMKQLHTIQDYRDRREGAKQLAAGIKEAREQKNTTKLEQVFRGDDEVGTEEDLDQKSA